jgi:hypothetical protein
MTVTSARMKAELMNILQVDPVDLTGTKEYYA